MEFIPRAVLTIGPVLITDTVVFTWLLMAFLFAVSVVITRKLSLIPSPLQEAVEALFEAMEGIITETLGIDPWEVIPFIGTLWIFIGASNLMGLVPGLKTPTADINTAFAFATVSYISIHYYGIRRLGLKAYILHYTAPSPILLPLHLMADISRSIALSVRLFGNMISGEMIAAILLAVTGLLIPVAMDLLHIIIGIVQAYIFGALTLAFIAGGITQEENSQEI